MQRWIAHSEHSCGRAMTLIELIVVIGIVVLLMSILLPTLGRARRSATTARCMARTRELGMLVSAYTSDFRGRFPAELGDGSEVTRHPELWPEYTFQPFSTIARPVFRDWAGLSATAEVLHCPANKDYVERHGDDCTPDFCFSASLYAEVSYLDPALGPTDWMSRLGAKIQTLDAATFPAAKAGLFEFNVWHDWGGAWCEGCDATELSYLTTKGAGNVWFLDGHAAPVRQADISPPVFRYPIWPTMKLHTTEWGITGRDIK